MNAEDAERRRLCRDGESPPRFPEPARRRRYNLSSDSRDTIRGHPEDLRDETVIIGRLERGDAGELRRDEAGLLRGLDAAAHVRVGEDALVEQQAVLADEVGDMGPGAGTVPSGVNPAAEEPWARVAPTAADKRQAWPNARRAVSTVVVYHGSRPSTW